MTQKMHGRLFMRDLSAPRIGVASSRFTPLCGDASYIDPIRPAVAGFEWCLINDNFNALNFKYLRKWAGRLDVDVFLNDEIKKSENR